MNSILKRLGHLHGHPWGTFFLRLMNLVPPSSPISTEATVWQMVTVIFLLLSSSDICLHQPLWMKFPAPKCEFVFFCSLLSVKCIFLKFGFRFGECYLHFPTYGNYSNMFVCLSMHIGFHVIPLIHNYTAANRSHTRDVLKLIDCVYFYMIHN